ncbi:MAG TPA: TadE/TadG family type IV pilus assembly protein [Rhizomicrobium sp.]
MDRARALAQRSPKRIGGYRRRDSRDGSAAIEFAIIAPILVFFVIGLLETGAIYYFNSMMANAAGDAARMLRTGQVQTQGLTQAQYVAQICSEMTAMVSLSDCNSNLQVDMEAFNSYTNADYADVVNSDGSLNTGAMQFNPGNSCDTVLVRAFYPWSIMTPLMKPVLQNMPNGQYLMTSAAAFRNEPFTAGASC